jgi:hypothetical protein
MVFVVTMASQLRGIGRLQNDSAFAMVHMMSEKGWGIVK